MSHENQPERIEWRGLRLKKSAIPYNGKLAQYESESFSQDVKLWMWNSTQWGASFDGASYSVADSYEEALVLAASKAISYHDSRRWDLFDLIARWEYD